MVDLADIQGYEFMRPLCQGWLSKIEGALTSPARKKWVEVSNECLMFYNKSASAMWDQNYTGKFWRGVKPPRFRVTINKAFEYVAVFGPNLLWDIPHREVTPKKNLAIPQELFPDPAMYQAMMAEVAMEGSRDRLIAHLMQSWLNYTPQEQPHGGLEYHNEMTVLDAMLTGQGLLWPAVYSFPGSERTLTGCFRKPPQDLIYDPDFKTAGECKWVALRHTDTHWEVERRFGLPTNSLKSKATLESSWHYSEASAQTGRSSSDRQGGKTNDLIVWYEIWSKMGTGARMTGMPGFIKGRLEEVVGDYAYICICPDCPYPLNCPADKIRNGASDEEVRQHFEWPVPLWTDSRWPFEPLIFYQDPDSPYGVPPLSPALGELKAINAIVSWLVNRTWQASRQMWAVLGQYRDEMKKVLDEGDDQCVFEIPVGPEQEVGKIIQLLEMPEVNRDVWEILELLSSAFDKRTGLTEFGAYGLNQDGTQSRTAEDVQAKTRAFGVRPEFMQKKVAAHQGRVANVEAMLAWMLVKGPDTQGLLGRVGAGLWTQFIENGDHEQVMRQMRFDIAASSIRRPDRDRDIANFQEFMGRWLPVLQKYGEGSGDYSPCNGAMGRWGELHDMERMEEMFIPAKDPNSPEVQMAQQAQQAEIRKTNAEAQKAEMEAQADPAEAQRQEMQLEAAKAQQEAILEREKHKMEMAMKLKELEMKAFEAQQKAAIDQQKMKADLAMQVHKTQSEHALKLQEQKQQNQLDITKAKADMDLKFKGEEAKRQQETQKTVLQMQLKAAESAIEMALKKMEAQADQKLQKQKADDESRIKEKEQKMEKVENDRKYDMEKMGATMGKQLSDTLTKTVTSLTQALQTMQQSKEPAKSGKKRIKVLRDKDNRIEGLEAE